jgi:hypothetical protein
MDAPDMYEKIMHSLKPSKGDIIAIGSKGTYQKGEYSAIAAAWTLLESND